MADSVKGVVESLIHCQLNMLYPPKHIISWIEASPLIIKKKLQRAGLIDLPEVITVDQLVTEVTKIKLPDIKNYTAYNYNHNANRFMSFFGKDFDTSKLSAETTIPQFTEWLSGRYDSVTVERTVLYIQDRLTNHKPITNRSNAVRFWAFLGRNISIVNITNKDVYDLKAWLLAKHTSATVHTTLAFVKQIFRYAVKRKYIMESPAESVTCGVQISREKDRTITLDEYQRILEACPSNQWRVIIALARIGGCRCPSEAVALRWADVNFENNVIEIHSVKTERHKQHSTRLMPLFYDLRVELERLYFDSDYDSKDFVITMFENRRDKKVAIGSLTETITKRAGLGAIDRFYDNCRTTRSNEIVRKYGNDLENAWLGHSDKVRKKYYWLPDEREMQSALDERLLPVKTPCDTPCDKIKTSR
jgi:integrase